VGIEGCHIRRTTRRDLGSDRYQRLGKDNTAQDHQPGDFQSAGKCVVQGKIGALLSVTSGIHPELTGRKNIYLYGAVMGMPRQTISRHVFDEIVEVRRPDRPSASSGQVLLIGNADGGLGFSIAAFTEPDVLLVDEVLSVGGCKLPGRNVSSESGRSSGREPPALCVTRPGLGGSDLR